MEKEVVNAIEEIHDLLIHQREEMHDSLGTEFNRIENQFLAIIERIRMIEMKVEMLEEYIKTKPF